MTWYGRQVLARRCGLLAARRLFPGAGDERVGRPVAEVPSQRQRVAQASTALGAETPGALGTREECQFRAFPDELGGAGEGEQLAGLEVDEQDAGPRVELQIAQGHEKEVAGEVGHHEAAVLVHANETGAPTAVRDIGAARGLACGGRCVGGDEQRVGAGDEGTRLLVKDFQLLDRAGALVVRGAHPFELPALDVLRAVAHGLVHCDREAMRMLCQHLAVHAIAPPRVELDAEKAQRRAGSDAVGKRVTGDRAGMDVERVLVPRLHEAGFADQHGRPRAPGRVDRTHQHERQLGVELLVLPGHEGPDDPLPHVAHAATNAQPLLNGLLAGVEGVVFAHG